MSAFHKLSCLNSHMHSSYLNFKVAIESVHIIYNFISSVDYYIV